MILQRFGVGWTPVTQNNLIFSTYINSPYMKSRFLVFLLTSSLIFNFSCQKEHSFEGGAGPSEGLLQDGGTGDCLPKTVAGTYVAGTLLDGAVNYIEVQVDVTLAGSYVITTDTINGIYFRGTGVFTATGLNTVRLKGNGTPAAAGVHNFIVSYGTSGCSIAVTTAGSLAAFTLGGAPGTCSGAIPLGAYMVGTPLDATNTVNINVDVTALGAYSISSSASNGMTFSTSGVFTTLGSQDVILTGTGTPGAAGNTTIPVIAGTSSCGFVVTVQAAVAPAVFTLDCASAVVNGTYAQGIALGAGNTIAVTANVTSVGPYIVTGSVGGMTFSASGTFTATGNTPLTLTGTGTPTTAGANSVPLTGATAACNVGVTVTPGGGGTATFTLACGTATVNGTYTVGVALGAGNTISINASVTNAGTYSITGTLNGMTFTGSGTFAGTGTQPVVLTATGTPTTPGANAVPLTGASAGCSVAVTVAPAAGGAAVFVANCPAATVNGTYTEGVALTAANTIVLPVTVTTAGTYSITATSNGMTFTASGSLAVGAQQITLTATGTPTADGTFPVAINAGTAPCSVDVDVDAATTSLGTWSFTQGATTFSGTFSDAGFDNTIAPPATVFFMVGETTAGHYLEIGLVDVSATVNSGEVYSCATFTGAANTGFFYFEAPPPASNVLYEAHFQIIPNTMSFTVTTHNVATKTITGTFSGTAQDENGAPKAITNGVFTVTYP